jgi:hypothetical protein
LSDGFTEEFDGALGSLSPTGDASNEGSFSGTVWAEESDAFGGADMQGDSAQGFVIPVGFAEIVDF